MKINVYDYDLTDETEIVEKVDDNGVTHYGARIKLRNEGSITLWIPWNNPYGHDGEYVASFLEELAEKCRSLGWDGNPGLGQADGQSNT